MHPRVRDLYKRLLLAGRHSHQGLSTIREQAKREFFKNAELTDEIAIKRAVSSGRYWVKEIYALQTLQKYRAMKNRYGADGLRR